jgi:DNA-binding NarL/FixJ family response regulator
MSQGANDWTSIQLPEQTIQKAKRLSQRFAKESTADLIEEAIEVYAQLRKPSELATYAELTPRLRQVLQLLAEGGSTKEIASRLNVSQKTVEFHRGRLMRQLGIRDIAGLVRFAVRVGAVRP